MGEPRVSVIVPNYNYGRYLSERLRSIVEQTERDMEIIVVDDGSDDDSVSVIKACGDERVRAEYYAENSGQTFRAHRRGAELARGEYLWWAESDDSCHPQLLERLVRVLDEYPDVGRVSAKHFHYGDGDFDQKVAELQRVRVGEGAVRVVSVAEELRTITGSNNVTCVGSTVVRRSVYERTSGFDTGFKICGDWKVWWELAVVSDVAYVDVPLHYQRAHGASASNDGRTETYLRYLTECVWAHQYFYRRLRAEGRLTADLGRIALEAIARRLAEIRRFSRQRDCRERGAEVVRSLMQAMDGEMKRALLVVRVKLLLLGIPSVGSTLGAGWRGLKRVTKSG